MCGGLGISEKTPEGELLSFIHKGFVAYRLIMVLGICGPRGYIHVVRLSAAARLRYTTFIVPIVPSGTLGNQGHMFWKTDRRTLMSFSLFELDSFLFGLQSKQ